MKIRVLSDVHLETHPFTIPALKDDADTILVLAGDIAPIAQRTLLQPFLIAAANRFRAVCYVPGNHEYYGSIWPDALGKLAHWRLPDNIHVMDRSTVTIDDVTFVGATLWADMERQNPFAMHDAARLIPDFKAIRAEGGKPGTYEPLSPLMTIRDHDKSVAWFDRELGALALAGKKAVMISHHGITPKSVHPRFRNNALTGSFVSDLTYLIEKHQPAVAIHGHVHDSFDYLVGKTRVVVNPRGYVSSSENVENTEFDPHFALTI